MSLPTYPSRLSVRQRNPPTVEVHQAIILLRREFAHAKFVREYPTLRIGSLRQTLTPDIAVFEHGVIRAVVEVGVLNGGPERLDLFAQAWPDVRVIWIPHCDLYPDYDRFRLSGQSDLAVVCRCARDETIKTLRAEHARLRRRADDMTAQRDDWKARARHLLSDVRWNTEWSRVNLGKSANQSLTDSVNETTRNGARDARRATNPNETAP